jgi:DNA polymerase-3 subunit gamma/tau
VRQSLYRQYRPLTFTDVVGQETIERTLRNAVATDTVAHAYLFDGPRGTGKTTSARLLAEAMVCEHVHDGEPDGTCEQCLAVATGTHPDVIELDAASRTGVENVRDEIINRVQFAPARGRRKVYIIDEVHMLSKGAFNALLKTLEEPPAHVMFILCTTDPQKVPETVRSRCQQFDFHPISVEDLTARLAHIADREGIKTENAALEMIARHADGGMRDAITTLEQMSAFTSGNITVAAVEETLGGVPDARLAALMRAVAQGDTRACFAWVAEVAAVGADLSEVVRALLLYVRDMYVIAVLGSTEDLINRRVDDIAVLRDLTGEFSSTERIAQMLDLLAELSGDLRWSTDPRLLLELTLTRMTRPESELTLEALAMRIQKLEEGVGEGTRHTGGEAARVLEQNLSEQRSEKQTAGTPSTTPSTTPFIPAPATPLDPVAGPMPLPTDAAELRRQWRAVLAELRKASVSRYPVFSESQARLADDGASLQIMFGDSFKLGKARRPDNLALLEGALRAVFGFDVPFTVLQGTTDSGDSEDPTRRHPDDNLPVADTSATADTAPEPDAVPEYEPTPDLALAEPVNDSPDTTPPPTHTSHTPNPPQPPHSPRTPRTPPARKTPVAVVPTPTSGISDIVTALKGTIVAQIPGTEAVPAEGKGKDKGKDKGSTTDAA